MGVGVRDRGEKGMGRDKGEKDRIQGGKGEEVREKGEKGKERDKGKQGSVEGGKDVGW